jgi:hypothetical protein
MMVTNLVTLVSRSRGMLWGTNRRRCAKDVGMAEKCRPGQYQAYLLRFWRDGTNEAWRASLQSTKSDQLRHFVSVEALFAFIANSLDVDPWHEPPSDTRLL